MRQSLWKNLNNWEEFGIIYWQKLLKVHPFMITIMIGNECDLNAFAFNYTPLDFLDFFDFQKSRVKCRFRLIRGRRVRICCQNWACGSPSWIFDVYLRFKNACTNSEAKFRISDPKLVRITRKNAKFNNFSLGHFLVQLNAVFERMVHPGESLMPEMNSPS